jgi:hypothetical protein
MTTLNTPDWKEKKGRTEDGVTNLKMKFVHWPNMDNKAGEHSKKVKSKSVSTPRSDSKGPTTALNTSTNTSASTSKK